MRPILLSLGLLAALSAPASAACRCACVLGQMRAICLPTDLVAPICQGICPDEIRGPLVARPLAGGGPVTAPVGSEASQGGNLNLDARGVPLGTAGVAGGNDALSGASSSGSAAAAAAAAGLR